MDIENLLVESIKDKKFKVTINELLNRDNLINILRDKEIELTLKEIVELSTLLEKKAIN